MKYLESIKLFLNNKTRQNFYKIFLNNVPFDKVLNDLKFFKIQKPIRQLGRNIDNLLSDLPFAIEFYIKYGETKTLSTLYNCSRTSINDVFRILNVLRNQSEAMKIVFSREEVKLKQRDKSKLRAEENIRKYGTACPYFDEETLSLKNFSSTSKGKLKQKEIAKKKLSINGILCPVKDKDGNLIHYNKTLEGRSKVFKVLDNGNKINFRKTLKGRKLSSDTITLSNCGYLRNLKQGDLYLIETIDNAFKIGISYHFLSSRIFDYTKNINLKILRIRLYTGLNTFKYESELKKITLKYGIHFFNFGVTGTFEWRNSSKELLEEVENYIIENSLVFREIDFNKYS